ncbi:MAG: hypothetical protein LBL04_03455 [Bacteroidales bacterium]|jgi:hypothetical protein|nr:hypothetical protein [Bacteroidales bacterium]
MQNIRFFIPLLIGGACMLVCHSCSTCSRQQTTVDNITIDLADLAIDSSYVNMAHKVFYALPTPIEMSMLIKGSGITYQPALLNDPANASKYLTNQKMALNFGGYITDLTYAGLFGQSQTVLRYKQAVQQLTDGLGLQSAIDPNTMQLLEANINNKDVVMRIISDTYASCTASLNENNRYFLTLAMLVGGWVEGMYIATSMTDEKLVSNEGRMKQLVIDQKLTFDMMWRAMSDLKNISEVSGMMNELSGLAQLFDKINVSQTSNSVTPSADGKTSNIASSNIHNATPELFAQIKDQIQALRHNFTKK